MRINKIIPSMYQRRLLLLGCMFALLVLAPAAQVFRLTVVKGETSRERAERKLVTQQWMPTVRGRVLDRHGRVLAFDRATFDIAFDYAVINGDWVYRQAARKARRLEGAKWAELSPEQRDQRIVAAAPEFRDRIEEMWGRVCIAAGVSRSDLNEQLVNVRKQVDLLAARVAEQNRRNREAELREKAARGAEQVIIVETADVRRQLVEEAIPQVVLRGMPESIGFAFMRLAEEDARAEKEGEAPRYPGLKVFNSGRREYPLETMSIEIDRAHFPPPLRSDRPAVVQVQGVGTHLLGWMRDGVTADDIAARNKRREAANFEPPSPDRARYFAADSVGAWGVESGAEDTLRGLRGLQIRHLDTGEVENLVAEPGRDVHLTIDAQLQARMHALFSPSLGLTVVQPWHRPRRREDAPPPRFNEIPLGTPLNGAAVVIDVDSGDVLAMVSHPTFTRSPHGGPAAEIWRDELNLPYLNRAINKSYTPGSIVKPLILSGAATMQRVHPAERIECSGKFYPQLEAGYQCWIFKQYHNTHGPLDGAEAIQHSCNIYFYELGSRLGPRGVWEWYRRFGVGMPPERHWNLGVGQEFAGVVKEAAKTDHREAVLMGIGQGPISWTPLHAADAYATLARAGTRIVPRVRADAPVRTEDLALDRVAVEQALLGLRWSCSREGGTTYRVTYDMPDGSRVQERIFDIPGITVWAKSGTADVAPFRADLNFDGNIEVFDGDHAWCVFLCGDAERPRYAVAVVIDHGGSGGRVAGPVATQVIRALMAEGYLPAAEDQRRAGR
ncbi:MAG: hypothetical protein KF699_01490 [Phycisphaeraceae bacterium]|nr:hypothetical protein [Phycisphaeraceae bacterium]